MIPCLFGHLFLPVAHLVEALDFHELTEFGNPDALFLKVGENGTIDSLSDVTTNTALFLGKTGAMDTTTFVRHGTSDDANSGHGNRSYLLMRER